MVSIKQADMTAEYRERQIQFVTGNDANDVVRPVVTSLLPLVAYYQYAAIGRDSVALLFLLHMPVMILSVGSHFYDN